MNITAKQALMIFRQAYENRVYFKIGISKKRQDGTYENGYIPVQFKKNVDVPDKTKIYIRDAWLSFYNKEESINGAMLKKTIPYIFINDFITMQEQIANNHVDFGPKAITQLPIEGLISEDDLPW